MRVVIVVANKETLLTAVMEHGGPEDVRFVDIEDFREESVDDGDLIIAVSGYDIGVARSTDGLR